MTDQNDTPADPDLMAALERSLTEAPRFCPVTRSYTCFGQGRNPACTCVKERA